MYMTWTIRTCGWASSWIIHMIMTNIDIRWLSQLQFNRLISISPAGCRPNKCAAFLHIMLPLDIDVVEVGFVYYFTAISSVKVLFIYQQRYARLDFVWIFSPLKFNKCAIFYIVSIPSMRHKNHKYLLTERMICMKVDTEQTPSTVLLTDSLKGEDELANHTRISSPKFHMVDIYNQKAM